MIFLCPRQALCHFGREIKTYKARLVLDRRQPTEQIPSLGGSYSLRVSVASVQITPKYQVLVFHRARRSQSKGHKNPFELGLPSQKGRKVSLQRGLRKEVARPTEDMLEKEEEEAT